MTRRKLPMSTIIWIILTIFLAVLLRPLTHPKPLTYAIPLQELEAVSGSTGP